MKLKKLMCLVLIVVVVVGFGLSPVSIVRVYAYEA